MASPLPTLAQQPAGNAPSPNPNYWDWFKYSPRILEKWVVEATENPNHVELEPIRRPASGVRKRVLVMYPRPSSAYDISITKILNVFEDKLIDASFTAMNFLKDPARGRAIMKRSEAGNYDLILAMGSETTAWLWENYRGGRIPVVSVCSKDPVVLGQSPGYNRGSNTNFAFTSLNMPIDVQMAYVHDLKPKLRNIAILVDSRNVSAIETQSKPVLDYAKSRGIRTLELSVQDPANARAELEAMVKDATAQMMRNDPDLSNSIYWVTGSTSVFREIATINAYSSRAAVLSVVPDIVRGGADSAVLSIGISFESNAHLAAVYAAEILTGRQRVGEMRVGVVSPPDIAINFRKARDIGMAVPLSFFEAASTIYDYEGNPVRIDGVGVKQSG
ncbi:ABC transporter substrate-binding protein [Rhabdaerophilum sp.]|uniref:ABC transporter substrate-binding protein n=1 Tax=Rhabdaerophilum sp. TaxID=2717341 RepID=UPI0038D514F2